MKSSFTIIACLFMCAMASASDQFAEQWNRLGPFGKGVGVAKIKSADGDKFIFFDGRNGPVHTSILPRIGVVFPSIVEASDFVRAKPAGALLFVAGDNSFIDDAKILRPITAAELLSLDAALATTSRGPESVVSAYELVAKKIDRPASGLRIRVSRIPGDVDLDPYPSPENFAKAAGIVVSLNVDYCREDTLTFLKRLKDLGWDVEQSLQGYAPLRIEILAAGEERFLDLFIDEKNAHVRVGDTWYAVRAEDLRGVVSQCITLSNACLEGKHISR